MIETYTDIALESIDAVIKEAWNAFLVYRRLSLKERAAFMRTIAEEIGALGDELLITAQSETQLPEARLRGERTRTQFQLTSYADACERGDWLETRIDTALPYRTPPRPDLRKMLTPIGPVLVFGAANFPFAYSTAGGDTACALAAGCPVVVKAHPAHAHTSEMMANAIGRAVAQHGLPQGIFTHIHGASFEVGRALVEHPLIKAVGFTGSFAGGKQLYDWACQRKEPIPVFAEMSSINPVFLLPDKMNKSADEVATQYAGSITLGVGQFCTNPGLLIGIDNKDLGRFITTLAKEIHKSQPGDMLNPGIFKNYVEKRGNALAQESVETVAVADADPQLNQGTPTLASVSAMAFLDNPILHQEVFGPYSLVIRCKDEEEMIQVAKRLEGQLTATLMATEKDVRDNAALIDAVQDICGRFILNSVPTGVEVSLAQQHGGPFPATTDSRFTSVGADGIKRFARPLAYQNWPDEFLPMELKNANPLGLWRTIDNELTRSGI